MNTNHSLVNATFNCGYCHSMIKTEDFDSSFLSLSKLQLDSIAHPCKISNSSLSDSKHNNTFIQDFQSSITYKNRHKKHNQRLKLKDSSYIILNDKPQQGSEDFDSSLVINTNDHAISKKIKALEPVFDIINNSLANLESLNGDLLPNIKHPLCKECCEILKAKLNEKFENLLSEKEKYQNFLKKLQVYKARILEQNNKDIDTAESLRSFSYSLSPKKRHNDKRLSMQSIEERSPDNTIKSNDNHNSLSKVDISNLQDIKRINNETEDLIKKIKDAKIEKERLDQTLSKEKLLEKKKKKNFLAKANVENTQKYLQYKQNLKKWNDISVDIESAHEELAKLRNLNIYNTVFNISTVDVDKNISALDPFFDMKKYRNGINSFGCINDLKLGCSWRETNAALGQVTLCLCNLSIPISINKTICHINSDIEWFPLGSVSKLIKAGLEYNIFYDPLDTTLKKNNMPNSIHKEDNANNWKFLFFKNNSSINERKEIKINKLKKFNESMVIILKYINTLLSYYNEMKVKIYDRPVDEITVWTLPYKIEDDKINNISIKYNGSDVEWALSCKFLLINLKYLMIYRHKLYLLECESN